MLIKTDPGEFQSYLSDASNSKGFCDALYIPESPEELSSILTDANKTGTPVTISGGGTGLTGGRCPNGGILISMELFNRIEEINTDKGFAICGAGVPLSAFQERLGEKGFFYAPDPTEQSCFLGGSIAANASGAKSFGYGPTRAFVLELGIILPQGEMIHITRGQNFASNGILSIEVNQEKRFFHLPGYTMPRTKNAAGYYINPELDAIDLFIGAEGTLGIIYKAKLRILPLPEAVISCAAFFPEENQALTFIEQARDAACRNNQYGKLSPRALEFFDSGSLGLLREDFNFVPGGNFSAVWFEQECEKNDESEILADWIDLIKSCGGNDDLTRCAMSAREHNELKKFRHAVSYKVNEYIAKNNLKKLGTDTAVPDESFRKFFASAKRITAEAGLPYVAYGHFGQSHLHLNMLPSDGRQMQKGSEAYGEICRLAVSFGGTVSAEHGIGKTKHKYLEMMYGKAAVSAMRALKKEFDPQMLLNRANMFAPD